MGGFGSGRYGGGPTTDDGLTLDLGKLMRDGLVPKNASRAGSLIWTNTRTQQQVASLGYSAWIHDEEGSLRLQYTTTLSSGEKRRSDYTINLESTPQPFGGQRWWFLCPRTNRRCTKLHLPPGAFTFASRQSHRLAYRSQRETPYNRALSRAFKLRDRLGSKDGIGDYIPKPKGMRWATFQRQIAEVEAAEEIVDANLWLLIKRLGGAI